MNEKATGKVGDESVRRCGICSLIEQCRGGEFGDFIAELPRSFLILGDSQFYRGYCLLLAKEHVTELHLMEPGEARALFDEAVVVGRAIATVTRPLKLNYECLGNIEPHVHWHVLPRYESDKLRAAPAWVRPESERRATLEESDRLSLIRALGMEVRRQMPTARLAAVAI
jgi:diadenosine tetraphosphate (Ap4A) HIT family hydrolase